MNNFYNFGNSLNMIDNFSSILNLNLLNKNVISLINSNQLRNMYNFFNYLFNENFDRNCFFNNLLDSYNLLPYDFDLSDLDNWNMNNLFNDCWLLHFNNFFPDYFLSNKFRDLNNSINNFFNYSWNFDNFFNLSLNSYDLIMMNINIFYNFYWNVNNSFNFNDLRSLNYLFNNLFNWNNLWNFNNSINDFLHNFFNFDNLWDNPKYFQNVINIDNIHNLSINHTNDSFIDIQNCSCLSFQFFELFKKSFD